MVSTPQEALAADKVRARPLTGNEVVISGMSEIFPKSDDSVLEFSENLYNKVDKVTTEDSSWVFNHPEVPKHLVQVRGMGKFDAQFFRVHYKQACTMETMSRKLLEHAYRDLYDSGVCVFPEAAYLVILWETLAMYRAEEQNSLSVAFYNVEFHSEINIREEVPIRLEFMINKGNNQFEVSYENSTIVTGSIVAVTAKEIVSRKFEKQVNDADDITLTSEDIYTMMNLRGYSYK
ncbi:hypothetical protein K1T71_008128 [Dendrolimus kikuchii]|uniref:Uncharacterized protein n=1 Tax=Dendrolimus kikuchii TaxID=765133 RepID=A0ACC1CW72_9NEOP|nr:hypothetical protein K1T71_008128 [Dendrolimus kikuchii]